MAATIADPTLDEYVVLRPFTGPDSEVLARGTVIDTRSWRNVQPLVNTRYLAPLYTPEGRAAVTAPSYEKMFGAVVAEAQAETPETDATTVIKRGPGRPRKDA